jgi:type IV pilus assembly protein PilM
LVSWTRHRAGPIAIDFGSRALRVMQLGGREDQTRILVAACHVYPDRPRGTLPEQGEILDTLRRLLREKRFGGKQVVSALGERDLLVKNIRLPEMPEAELASAVRYEAIERVAELDEEAEIRFLPAGSVAAGAGSQQEVIVLAATAPVVRRRLELLAELGLESVGIDASVCAVFRPFERYLRRTDDREQVNVFADIGWSGTRIIVSRGDRIAFTKSFEEGGARFDQRVSESLSVDPGEAAELRRQVAMGRPVDDGAVPGLASKTAGLAETVRAAMRPGLEQLGKEIGLCLRYYAVTFRGRRPDTITCVGGESLDPYALEYLSEITGLPCRVGFPLRSMSDSAAVAKDVPDGPLADWATVAGLALKPVVPATVRAAG